MNSIPLSALPELERWATFREAMAQPRIWRSWATKLAEQARSVSQWMSARAHTEVWFCGAGTSAFIGETLAPYLGAPPTDIRYRSVPTTDLVSCPAFHSRTRATSGGVLRQKRQQFRNRGVLDLLDKYLPDADRLHFTCNAEGGLATRGPRGPGEQRVVLLPDETNDRGFAMTSSYSTMLLSALACLDRRLPGSIEEVMGRLADSAEAILERSLERAADEDELPSRAIFLGCGALTGSAREAALKVLELTGPHPHCLGFRALDSAMVPKPLWMPRPGFTSSSRPTSTHVVTTRTPLMRSADSSGRRPPWYLEETQVTRIYIYPLSTMTRGPVSSLFWLRRSRRSPGRADCRSTSTAPSPQATCHGSSMALPSIPM